jgi:hypothetical protein
MDRIHVKFQNIIAYFITNEKPPPRIQLNIFTSSSIGLTRSSAPIDNLGLAEPLQTHSPLSGPIGPKPLLSKLFEPLRLDR